MALSEFRRFPLRRMKRWNLPVGGAIVVRAFESLDRNGQLSDICADPQRLYEWWWPYKAIRRKFLRIQRPCVSVIVATRNNEATIERSLRSLTRQTLNNLEIIVVDDASTDGSLGIIREIARADHRIRVITNARQLGTGASRNRGLQAATGDYVTFQDGDDFSAPSRLEMQCDALQKFPGKKLVLCNYVRVNEDGARLQINDRRVMKCIISMMFPRREVLDRVGFFLESNLSEDADFYERIKIAFGKGCELLVFRTLYEALFRNNSSFFSEVDIQNAGERVVRFTRKAEAAASWEAMQQRHAKMRKGEIDVYVSPARLVTF
ncbi:MULTISPECIES: glycosyltransferase family 2 protein [Sinorhizobium]|nr:MULTISPECIES: glycosyltransferase family A protein [Sinorhizobium]